MKWGIRRYQNEDGSLTDAGRKRYSNPKKVQRDLNRLDKQRTDLKGDQVHWGIKKWQTEQGAYSKTKHAQEQKPKIEEKMRETEAKREAIRQDANRIIDAATHSGLRIDVIPTTRFFMSSQAKVKANLMGPLGWMIVPGLSNETGMTNATKFRVTRDANYPNGAISYWDIGR